MQPEHLQISISEHCLLPGASSPFPHMTFLLLFCTPIYTLTKRNQTQWPKSVPTGRPPIVGKVSANFLRIEGATWLV
jgi:hypothetical protein